MLRTLFVIAILLTGIGAAFQGPFYTLLLYIWISYFRPEQWLWYDFVTPLRLPLVIGIGLVVASAFSAQTTRERSWMTTIAIAFVVQGGLSLLTAQHFATSLDAWLLFVRIILVALLIPRLVDDESRFRTLLMVMAVSLGFEAAKQGWGELILRPGLPNTNPHPVFGDNNGVAVAMMMLTPIVLALARTAKFRWEKAGLWLLVVGCLYRGLSTYSRGGLIAAAGMTLVVLWQSKHRVRSALAICLLAGAATLIMPDQFWARMQTINAADGERDDSQLSRLYTWGIATRMGLAHPLLGVGFDGYRVTFSSYDTADGQYGTNRSVHSAWYGVFAEMGFPGLFLLASAVLGALITCWRIRSHCRGAELSEYAGAIQASVVAYALGMTFLTGQYNEMFWHLIGCTAALSRLSRGIADQPARTTVIAPGVIRRLAPREAQA